VGADDSLPRNHGRGEWWRSSFLFINYGSEIVDSVLSSWRGGVARQQQGTQKTCDYNAAPYSYQRSDSGPIPSSANRSAGRASTALPPLVTIGLCISSGCSAMTRTSRSSLKFRPATYCRYASSFFRRASCGRNPALRSSCFSASAERGCSM